jgi:hypothetical protein
MQAPHDDRAKVHFSLDAQSQFVLPLHANGFWYPTIELRKILI